MSNLNITTRRSGDVVILDLNGQIRLGESNINLHNAIRDLADAGEKKILINLAKVTHIDSSGLGELVGGYATMEKLGGNMKLVNLNDRVTELIMITKLLTVFDVYEDEATAIASFGPTSEASQTA
jgi:anti-sigma B factor antagonist